MRIVFGSPRFSEDLDFSAAATKGFESLLLDVIADLDAEGIALAGVPSSSPTTGGFLAVLDFQLPLPEYNQRIKLNVQVKRSPLRSETTLVSHDFGAPYSLVHLATQDLVNEKISALLRRAKPRDYFDLYFILKTAALRSHITRTPSLRDELHAVRARVSDRDLESGLKRFLPVKFHNLFQGGLKAKLGSEITTYL